MVFKSILEKTWKKRCFSNPCIQAHGAKQNDPFYATFFSFMPITQQLFCTNTFSFRPIKQNFYTTFFHVGLVHKGLNRTTVGFFRKSFRFQWFNQKKSQKQYKNTCFCPIKDKQKDAVTQVHVQQFNHTYTHKSNLFKLANIGNGIPVQRFGPWPPNFGNR